MALWPEAVEVDVTHATRGPLQVTIDEEGETRVHDRFVVYAPVAGRLRASSSSPVMPSFAARPSSRGWRRLHRHCSIPGRGGARGSHRCRARSGRSPCRSGSRRGGARTGAQGRSSDRSRWSKRARLPGRISRTQTAAKTADSAFRAAEAAVARAEQELRLAQARRQSPPASGPAVDVVAPVDGVVLKRLRESETVVPRRRAAARDRRPSAARGRRRPAVHGRRQASPDGSPVSIEQWGGGQPLQARVRRVEPSGFTKVSALGVEEQRVNVIIDFGQPAAAVRALGDSYRVEVRIVVWQDENVLKVPVGSLFRRGNEWAVFVVNDNHARLQTVRLGQRNNDEGQILKGLDAGRPSCFTHPIR